MQILIQIVVCIFILDACFAFSSALLLVYTFNIFIKNINRRIQSALSFKTELQIINNMRVNKSIKLFIVEHIEFCKTLDEITRFWSKLYFAFILTQIPVNLVSFHQFFFESLNYNYMLFIGFSSFVQILDLFLIQYCFAYTSNQIHKTTKLLARLQWRLKGSPFQLRNKIKLMTYFERLNSNQKIGITLGPTIALTFPVFAQVFRYQESILKLIIAFIIDCRQIYSLFYSHS